MIIGSAGTHLYTIGLSLYKPYNRHINRHITNNPYFIFALILMLCIRQIIFMTIPGDRSVYFYALIGDVGYILGFRFVYSIIFLNLCIIIIFSQILNFY